MDQQRLDRLLDIYPQSFAQEIGIDVENGTPVPLYQWAVASTLFANPVQHDIAVDAAKSLIEHGLTSPEKMAAATWADRRDALRAGRYGQYEEMMSEQLGDAAEWLLETYGGDLRNLREEAGQDPAEERERLQGMNGIGETAAEIFFRDVQSVWKEHHPLVGELPMKAAKRLGIASSEGELAEVGPDALPQILSALVRAELNELDPERLDG